MLFLLVPTLTFVTSVYLFRIRGYFFRPFLPLSIPPHHPSPMRDASSSPHLPLASSQAPAASLPPFLLLCGHPFSVHFFSLLLFFVSCLDA